MVHHSLVMEMESDADPKHAVKAAVKVLDESIKRRQDKIDKYLAEIKALEVKRQQWLTKKDTQMLACEEPAVKRERL